MNSMTGYGSGSAQHEALEVIVEINSVNRKALEINASLPRDWQNLEPIIIQNIRKAFKRGKINAYIKVKDYNQLEGFSWDEANIMSMVEKIKQLATKLDTPFSPTPELLFNVSKTISQYYALPTGEAVEALVKKSLEAAVKNLSAMRKSEGKALAQDIQQRLSFLEKSLQIFKDKAPEVLPRYRKQFFQRLEQAGLAIDLNDERILKEIAIFADRSDVTEEIVRLESHLKQFKDNLSSTDPVGRKFDFLCQEINRELNTIGTKANFLEITQTVITAKNELERIREQAQNIE